MSDLELVSIIIPTKDRAASLENTLLSILEAGDTYYELLVIDSSVNENYVKVNRRNTTRIGGKYFLFNEKGLSKARNKGIKESRGNIIVFADDDFIVRKGWISNLTPNFKNSDVSCVTGRMISYRNDDSSNLYEKALSFDRGPKKRVFSEKNLRISNLFLTITKIGEKKLHDKTPAPWGIGYGFSAFRRRVFQDIGLFDENLGRGTKAVGGEDIDMLYRILKARKKILYEPTAIILHEHRKDLKQVFEDARNAGKSVRAFVAKYWKRDAYIQSVIFGYIFLCTLSAFRSRLKSDWAFEKMIKMELKGFLESC